MAKAPTVANGIDIDSDAPPPGGDTALVGDAGGDGHTIVEDGDEESDSWDTPEGAPKSKKSAERQSAESDDDSEYDEEDSRLAYSDSDDLPPGHEEREARGKRARRNARRSRMKQAADSEIMALREALSEQGRVLKSLVTGQSSLAANTVAGEIAQLEGSLRIASEEKATAIKNSDGDTYAKAESIRDQIIERLAVLRAQKSRMDAMVSEQGDDTPQQRQQQQRQPQADPRVVQAVESYFDRFCDRFPWFDAESTDPDSNIVRAVDAHLVNQGYQRHTPVFWQQLERTLASRYKLTPSRPGEEQDDGADDLPPPRRAQQREAPAMNRGGQRPPTGNGRGTGNGKSGFSLDATKVSLLREEGLVGDNLSKEDVAKRDRIISKWRAGADALKRQGVQ